MTTKIPDSLLVSGGGGGGGGGGSGDMLAANNLSELPNKALARSNLGLGTLATQSGTFSGSHSGNSSGTNTGDQDVSGLMVKANNLGDVVNAATARSNLGLGTAATQNATISGTHSGTSSGTNTGDQTIVLTGDVTGSGTGSFPTTIANDAVTNAKLANMTTKTYKGRTGASTGDPEDVPVATLKSDLALTKSDVGLSNVDNTADSTKTVADSVKWNGHNITVSSSAPSGGADGDIWLQYTP